MDGRYLQELATRLTSAGSGTSDLNIELGRLAGYSATRDAKDTTGAILWLDPDGSRTRLPSFTQSLDAAIIFSERLLPGHMAAVSWGSGEQASARVNNGPICFGSTEAVALCNAAILALLDESIKSRQP